MIDKKEFERDLLIIQDLQIVYASKIDRIDINTSYDGVYISAYIYMSSKSNRSFDYGFFSISMSKTKEKNHEEIKKIKDWIEKHTKK